MKKESTKKMEMENMINKINNYQQILVNSFETEMRDQINNEKNIKNKMKLQEMFINSNKRLRKINNKINLLENNLVNFIVMNYSAIS